jgi:hypothetical protein
MYLLTIRDGLQTRHIGPYESPARAVEDLDALLGPSGDRARWQIHELESPVSAGLPEVGRGEEPQRHAPSAAVAA